jgi:hypothetical protein
VPAGARAEVRRASTRRGRPPRLEAAIGYALVVPLDPTWIQHDLGLRLTAPLGRLPLAVELDGAVGSRPTGGPPGYAVTLYDVPLGVALLGRLQLGRWLLTAGPRAALHIFGVSADSPDGRSGSAHRLSAGLGAVGQVRFAILEYLALALTLTAEGLVPGHSFTVDGAPGASPGAFAFGASLGVVFRLF